MRNECWLDLRNILRELYHRNNVLDLFVGDEEYLECAYHFTEDLWHRQYESFNKICFVLLGEAPLFGEQKSYFYNEDSELTAFFRHKISPDVVSFSSQQEKSELFTHLRENGFIILDLFPYAFSEKVAINYKDHFNDSTYTDLIEKTYDVYLKPKLKLVKEKSASRIRFCLRYKKHMILSEFIRDKLNALELIDSGDTVGCVGSLNMPIDKDELAREYKKACRGL